MIKFAPDLPAFAVKRIKDLEETIPFGRVISGSLISEQEIMAAGLIVRSDEIAVDVRVEYVNGRVGTLSLVFSEKDVRSTT